MVFDTIASRVRGLVTASDCRVVWTEGHLYICRTPTDITVFECEVPKKIAGSYRTQVGEGTIVVTPPGCGSCRRRVAASPVGQMSVEQIVGAAASVGT